MNKVSNKRGLHNRGTKAKKPNFDFPRICQGEILFYEVLKEYKTLKFVRHILLYDLSDGLYYELYKWNDTVLSKFRLCECGDYLIYINRVRFVKDDKTAYVPYDALSEEFLEFDPFI